MKRSNVYELREALSRAAFKMRSVARSAQLGNRTSIQEELREAARQADAAVDASLERSRKRKTKRPLRLGTAQIMALGWVLHGSRRGHRHPTLAVAKGLEALGLVKLDTRLSSTGTGRVTWWGCAITAAGRRAYAAATGGASC